MSRDSPQVQAIFFRALDTAPADRDAFLDGQCGDDSELRGRVVALLEAHGRSGSFLDSPFTDFIERAPKRLGEFRIIREVGRGGMGIVYEAHQTSLGRRVALKVLPSHLIENAKYKKRFLREAKAAARLHHTNIVPVFGVGEEDGVCFYVMQIIHGQGLDRVLEELKWIWVPELDSGSRSCTTSAQHLGASDIAHSLVKGEFQSERVAEAEQCYGKSRPQSAAIVSDAVQSEQPLRDTAIAFADETETGSDVVGSSQRFRLSIRSSRATYYKRVAGLGIMAANALEYAHCQNVLHRDIKPSNLILDFQGTLWIADFGLAKIEEQEDLTHSGDVLGTLRYMAPERLEGVADVRSDVYSLGLTLYEMLALKPAFDQSGRGQLIKQLTKSKPRRLRDLDRRIPSDLETVIHKSIDADPEHRYQTARQLAEDLQRFVNEEPIQARSVSNLSHCYRWCRRNPAKSLLSATILLLMMLVTLGSLVWAAQAESARRLIASEQELSARNLYESYVSQIAAHRFSRRPGQRIESLKAIQNAALMKVPFKLKPEKVLDLRSDAIAALGLMDIELVHEEEFDVRDWWMTLDEQADLMARLDRGSHLTVQSRKDGSSLNLPIRIPAYAKSIRRFTQRGRFLVVLNEHGGGWVWDIRSNRRHFQFQTARTLPGQFDCHGSTLAFVDQQGRVKLINLESRNWLLEIPVQARSLAFSKDGSQLAVGLETASKIQIYQANTGELVTTLSEWKRDRLCWSPDGRLLVCAQDEDYWMAVWNVQTRTPCPMLRGHKNGGNECAFNESSKILVSTGWDGVARFWHPLNRDELLISEGNRCQFHDRGLLTLYTSRRATTWKLRESLECKIFIAADRNLGSDRFTDCVFLEPHGLLAVSRLDGVRIWDVETDREVAFFPIGYVDSIAYDRISASLFTKGKWGVLQWQLRFGPGENVWQFGPPRQLLETSRGQAGAENLAIARNAAKLATTVGAHALAVVDLDMAATVNRLGKQGNVHSVAVAPDGRCVASSPNFGKGVKIWDANTGELIRELWPECFGASVAYSPQGDHLAVCGQSRIRIYASDSWEVAHEIKTDHETNIIRWSPDGRRLACCNDPNVAILFDVETGEELASFRPPIDAGNFQSIDFSQKEDKLAVVYRNAVACWDLRRVRDELSAMGLDWEAPPVAPRDASDLSGLTIQIDYGQFATRIEQ